MQDRDIPRDKLLSRDEILDARIIRSDLVKTLYGEGYAYAQPKDELDRKALAGEPQRVIRDTYTWRAGADRADAAQGGSRCTRCRLHRLPYRIGGRHPRRRQGRLFARFPYAAGKSEPVAPKAVAQPAPGARAKPVPMAGVDYDDEWEEFQDKPSL
jgi:hypothetical protein